MADAYTNVAAISNAITTAVDQAFAWNLRSTPLFRNVIDKRPDDVPIPGNPVRMFFYSDIAVSTSTLDEEDDPDAVALGNPTYVDIAPGEYGLHMKSSKLARLTSFSGIESAIMEALKRNMVDTLDALVAAKLYAGTNRVTANASDIDASPVAVNTLAATDLYNPKAARYVVAQLRANSVETYDGEAYVAFIHPHASADFRTSTSTGAWLTPHQYASQGNIWKGEIGMFEGVRYIETPRAKVANDGASSAAAYRTAILGRDALAEAVWEEPHSVIGDHLSPLKRSRSVGWTGVLGHEVYRQAALYRVEHGSGYAA